jgi:hypothetical protein
VKDDDEIEVIIDEEGRIIDPIVPVVGQGGPIIVD